jgi:uncharacterized MAPEG superfamily protein
MPLSSVFTAYAVCLIVLTLNLMVLWAYSGVVRAKTKTAVNAEDAALYKAELAHLDPPEVARVLRAHANAQATIYPFLFLGMAYVLADGSATIAWIVFGLFTLSRIAHSAAYLAGKQPWRSLSFMVSVSCIVVLMVSLGIELTH